MKTWFRQHVFALAQAFRQSFRPRSGFLLNVVVVAIALSLPFAGLTLLENVRPLSEQLAVDPEVSIFVAMDLPREQALALSPKISAIAREYDGKARIEFVSRDAAMKALKDKTGLTDALTTLGSNPLPDAYVVKFLGFRDSVEAGRVDAMVERFKALKGVEHVQLDSAWIKRLAALLHILRLALLLLAGALGVVVIAVVFNTIRLQVTNQHEEIEVSRLLGATDGFIYRPFYYTGALLGACAGILALAAVALALHPLNGAIADFARMYGAEFRLAPLGIVLSLGLLAGSALLGLAGSLLSVRRHLVRLAA